MAQQIEWTPQALKDYYAIIVYLEEQWSPQIADSFLALTEEKLFILAQQPFLGISSEKEPAVRSILLTKHNRLYYKVENTKLIVLSIFDTRQNPEKENF